MGGSDTTMMDASVDAPSPEGALSGGDSGREASSPDAAVDAGSAGWWKPSSAKPLPFHWQLSTVLAVPADVVAGQTVYDIDGEKNDAATVAALHALGPDVKVICYVNVGAWEDFRPDAAQFPAAVIGSTNGWPGEKWLDARAQAILLPLMKARFVSWCVHKGFDAVEPDNLDAWSNTSGFPLTHDENIAYDVAIAGLVHSLGLSVGLKNLPAEAPAIEPHFDWALDEQCYEFSECAPYVPSFLANGKAVWEIEYNAAPNCADANAKHMNAALRDLNLVGPKDMGYVYQPCLADSVTAWP